MEINRPVIEKEELLDTMEEIIQDYCNHENRDFSRGIAVGLELLKIRLGYPKMLSLKKQSSKKIG